MKNSCVSFLIFSFFLLIACNDDVKTGKDSVSKKDALIENAKNVELLYSDSAIVRIRVQGARLLNHISRENPHEEFPDGVKIDFFDGQQKQTSVLTGKYAIRYPSKNQVIIRDSCVWKSISSQEKLESFELIWDENLQKVYSNKLVVITTPTEKIWGYGFETNQDFTRWKINKPQGRLAVDKIN